MSNTAYQVRERKGDVKPNRLRREKIVPGILYGAGFDNSLMIEMDQNELIRLLRENTYSSSIPLKGLSRDVNVIIKEIQNTTLTALPMHFDFQAIKKGEVVTVAVPVKITGEEDLKGKDILIQVDLDELQLKGPIEKLPDFIEVSVSELEVGDRIVISEVTVPAGAELLDDPEATVCIALTSAIPEDELEEADEATAPDAADVAVVSESEEKETE